MNGTNRERRDMLRARRNRQRTAGPSFTPFTNKRIQSAYQTLVAHAMMAGLDPVTAQNEAMQALAERLTVAPSHREYGRVAIRSIRRNRSSDPSYRKSIWPEGKVAAPGRMG